MEGEEEYKRKEVWVWGTGRNELAVAGMVITGKLFAGEVNWTEGVAAEEEWSCVISAWRWLGEMMVGTPSERCVGVRV